MANPNVADVLAELARDNFGVPQPLLIEAILAKLHTAVGSSSFLISGDGEMVAVEKVTCLHLAEKPGHCRQCDGSGFLYRLTKGGDK